MATNPATKKQLDFLKQLTGKDYTDEELTASEASKRIEKALANKGKEVAELEPQSKDEMLDEHKEVIKEARASVSEGKNRSFALSYAKDWCIAKVQGGEDIKTLDVLVVAKVFESYLDTGVVVEKKK